MKYILAFDQGTTSSRAIVFDQQGKIVSTAQREFPQIFPRPGWVEHDPQEIWASQVSVAAEALTKKDIIPADIAAIGITNQRETTVVWDRRTGKPIHNAIVWQDRRTARYCDELKDRGLEPTFKQKAGLVIDAYFAGTKIKWILDNVPGAREAAKAGHLACGTIDSWLVWHLTMGQLHMTDVTNACRTLCYNINTLDWDDELLDILTIPRSMLPEVRASSEVYGHASERLFAAPIPIAGIAGDQQAALFGQICTKPGMVKNTYGTGCFMLMNTGTAPVQSKNNLLTTIAWKIGNRTEYALEGSIFIAGAVVQWVRDGLGLIRSSSEIEGLARQVEDNGGVFLVPAFAGLGAPHWDQYARGAILGLTRGSKAAHIARAALESMAYQTVDVIRAMEADSGLTLSQLRVDGGATVNNLLMQFQSDLLGVPTIRPKVFETTALGAAYLAGLAVGFWSNTDEIAEQWQADQMFEPNMDRAQADGLIHHWHRALERAKGWDEHQEAAQ